MYSKQHNFLLILVGVLTTILFIEGGMRLFGWGYLYLQDKQNRTNLDSIYLTETDLTGTGDIVTLAIGESTTAFGGTNAWPNQLERILNSLQNRREFHVINRGVPATNTNAILNRLPDYLEKYKPNFVLAMVGVNDNFTDEEPLSTSRPLLEKLRIYKLIRWIWSGLNSRIQGHREDHQVASYPAEQNSLFQEYSSNDLREKYSSHTISNLNSMVTISQKAGARLIFVQYALTKVDFLQSVIERDVLVISNYNVFKRALDKYEYDALFDDEFAGHFGHATEFGNRILAENVARNIFEFMSTTK